MTEACTAVTEAQVSKLWVLTQISGSNIGLRGKIRFCSSCDCGFWIRLTTLWPAHRIENRFWDCVQFFDLKRHRIADIKTRGFRSLEKFMGSPTVYPWRAKAKNVHYHDWVSTIRIESEAWVRYQDECPLSGLNEHWMPTIRIERPPSGLNEKHE